jgi:hypothetical protein
LEGFCAPEASGIDRYELMRLGQLKNPIAIKPSRTLAERIRSLGNKFADFADELDELVDKVSGIFPHPPEDHLHIIVQPPAAGESSSLLSHIRSADDIVSPFTTCPSHAYPPLLLACYLLSFSPAFVSPGS